jgi:hypothetical protein
MRTASPAAGGVKYRIYIDEVGNPDLGSSDNPNHRYLSLTGVVLDLRHVQTTVHPQMEELKNKYFVHHPDEPVVLHRKEMHKGAAPFEALKTPGVRIRFDEELLGLLRAWDYTVITVCLDKRRHRETYATWRYDPYHYCLELLLERFYFFLVRHSAVGDVMAESRGGRENQRLMDAYTRLCERGTHYIAAEQLQEVLTSRQLKVRQKTLNITGLQLADLLARPGRDEILAEQGLLQKEVGEFGKRVVAILQGKYDGCEGRFYGKKFI